MLSKSTQHKEWLGSVTPTPPHSSGRTWMSYLGMIMLLLLSYGGAKAQLSSNYSFSQSSSGSYSAITTGNGASVFSSGSYNYYDVSSAITVPSFKFNGNTYSSLRIVGGGYITLGSTVPSYDYSPLSSGNGYSGVIAGGTALNYNCNGTILYQQVGNEFVVQWKGMQAYYQDGSMDFQIRINTCNGVIKIIYNGSSSYPQYYGYYNNLQVGLRGSSGSDFMNRYCSSGDWYSNGTAGSNNYDGCYWWTGGNGPASGLQYTYTPSSGGALAVNTIQYSTASIVSVAPGASSNEILKMDIDVQGVTGTLKLDTVVVTSNNTADADVSSVKLYTSSSNTFSVGTATQVGSSTTFSAGKAKFNTLNYSLSCGTTYLYVVYDAAGGATVGDYLDAKIMAGDIKIGGSSYPSSNKSPVGNRQIQNPMTYSSSSASQASTLFVQAGDVTQAIVGLQVDMSATGAPANIDSIIMNTTGTNGTNNATTNIQNAMLWYTGNSSTFAMTTQYGSTIANPNGQMNFIGTQPLSTNSNYFWLTYDIKSGANAGDTVDARAVRVRVGGSSYTPSTASPAGYRRIFNTYCTPNHSYVGTWATGMGITNVTFGNLNVSTTAGGVNPPAYSTSNATATLQRKSNPALSVTLGSYNTSTIGIVCWIDYNQDGDFYDGGEQILTTAGGNGTYSSANTFNISIPCSAPLGYTKMRVMAGYFSSSYWSDPCISYGYGETEDYLVNITDSALAYASSTVKQNNTLAVGTGVSNAEILAIPVVSAGCNGSLNATSFTLNTTGTTSNSDLTSAKIYYTGNSSTFATTTLFGSYSSPSGSYNITGTRALVADTNWFWVVYDIASGATVGNNVDAECTSLTVGGNAYTPSSTAPSGFRTIANPMTFNSVTGIQPSTGSVGKGTRYNAVLGIQVNMTAGSSVNLTQLKWSTNGTNNITSNVDTARIYYTGNSSTFATTTLFGTYQASPAATTTYTVNSTRALLPGNNYFWVAYSIKTGANTGDSVDARVSQVTVAGSPASPSVTDPTGKRKIIPQPCSVSNNYNPGDNGITNVTLGTINNSSGVPQNTSWPYTTPGNYTDYSSLTTTMQKGTSQALSVDVQGYNYLYVSAWIDWNQDATFQSGEKIGQHTLTSASNTSPTTETFTFDVPCSALNGQARMRIRQEYYYQTGYTQDPCNDLYYGYYSETEDYSVTVTDSPLTVVSTNAVQDITLPVGTGTSNNQIILIQAVAKGCTGAQTVTSIDLNTTGCNDPANDLDSAFIYYTGNSNTFATTTLFGKVGNNVLSGSYSITGSKSLAIDTNNFWLVYKVSSGATVTNYIDAQCTNLVINSTNYTPSVTSPSGNRQILNPMTYTSSAFIQTAFNGMTAGSTKQKIAGVKVVMSNGTSINIDSVIFTNTGTANISTNINNVKCWYTGNSSAFAATTQYGSTQTSFHGSGGEIWFGQSQALLPGDNYFWLTYDIKSGANVGDSIDATINRIVVNGTSQTPSPKTVAGKRFVMNNYCYYGYNNYNYYNYGITNVTLGSINNSTSSNGSYAYAPYQDYTSQSASLNTYQTYTMSLDYQAQYGYGQIAAWIDYNGDGDFSDANEFIGQPSYSSSSNSGTVTITFTVPCGAVTGQTRLRVREEYNLGSTYTSYPCQWTGYGYTYGGEVEDYTVDINNNPLAYASSTTRQENTTIVGTSTNNNEVIGVLVNTTGCSGTLNLTQLNFNTTGTTAASTDITNAKVWYTGTSNVFATTTQFGSAVASPNGTFSVSGTQALAQDSNHFWLTYNVNSVTVGNKIDAQCTGMTIASNNYAPSVTNPSGDRTITAPATYNTHTWSKNTASVGLNTANNQVTQVKITMNSGAAINLDSLVLNTTGNTSSSDVTNAKVWYTGSSSAFAATTQYGSTVASPNGTLNFIGSAALNSGDNYFWFSYDIPNTATTGDSVNANLVRLRIGATSYNASPSTVAGKSRIRNAYCAGYAGYYYNQYGYHQGITNVTVGGINNTSSVPAGTGDSYSDYTSQTGSLTKSQSYTLSLTTQDQNWGYSSYTTIWIDYDADGIFQSGESVGQIQASYNYSSTNTNTLNFTVPCNTITGNTRMRLVNEMYYSSFTQDPCNPAWGYMGEVEDYTVNISDMNRSISSSVAAHPTTLDVQPGTSNQQILSVRINSQGCANNLNVSQLNFSTSGTSGSAHPTTNITNAKVWYTGSSPVFAATTQYGSTVSSPSGAFAVNGSTTLTTDSAWFWLTYNVASGATVGDDLDAKITSMVVSSSTSTPSNNNPTGKRTINNPATYTASSMTMPVTSKVGQGDVGQQIVRVKVTMSSTGSPVPLNDIKLKTTGCTDPSNDISNATLFYTGSSTVFAATTQYGSTIASPNGNMSFSSSTLDLNPGDNYLFLTYDINSYATVGNVVTAEISDLTVNSTNHTPSNTTVSTTREIRYPYCSGYNNYYYGQYGYDQGITNITVAGINNTSGVPSGSPSYSDYTSLSGTVKKSLSYTIDITSKNQNWGYSGLTTVWIDWDGDGVFQSGESLGQISESYNYSSTSTSSMSFTVPCSASAGATRMRVVNEMYYTTTSQDPCNPIWGYLGEVEDYTINILDSPRNIVSTAASHPVTFDVPPSSTNAQMLAIRIDAAGCGNLPLTNVTLNTAGTNGSNNPSTNVDNAKLWYTTTNVFAATTQFGSSIANPSGSMSFSGSQNVDDSAWLWLTYDVAAGANVGDTLDAKVTSLTINSNTFNPSNSNPTGRRVINYPATYSSSSVTMPISSPVTIGIANQSIIRLQINMSSTGSPVMADQIDLNTNGCDNVSGDVTNATLWYTGSGSGFATTTQYGSAISSPSGTMTFIDNTIPLNPGTNYFYLTYDISGSATVGNEVTAEFNNVTISGTSNTPSNTTVSTKRKINPTYCYAQDCYQYQDVGITKVQFAGINNTSSLPSTYSYATYSDFTNIHASAQKSQTYSLTINVTDAGWWNSAYTGAWVDWDNDGVFQSSEKIGEATNNGNGTATFSVTVPCTAQAGTTRLRIRTEDHYGGSGQSDPCYYYASYFGEVEDYSVDIIDSSRNITSFTSTQPVTLGVGQGATNAQIMKVRINSGGCSTVPVTQFNFNTSGSTSASDITAAKLWYTGTSGSFATTTQFGSTVSSPSGSFSFNDNITLSDDSVWFWLTYDIASGATTGNVVDAQGAQAVVNSSNYGSISSVSGSRQIETPSSYVSSVTTQTNVSSLVKGNNNNLIVGAQIVMTSGSSQDLTNIEFTVTGSQNPSTNISKARCWYTGNSSTFATTTQYGTDYNSPTYNVSFNSSMSLQSGTNYFWLTYDVPMGANVGDSLDAQFEQFDLDSSGNTNTWVPSNIAVAGKRKIAQPYCTTPDYQYNYYNACGITNVTAGSINNTTSAPSNSPTHSDYTSLSTTIQKGGNYSVSISVQDNYNYQFTAAWIDFDGDATWSASEKLGQVYTGSSTGTITFNYTVPCGATTGAVRMRIRNEYYANNGSALDPCNYSYNYAGETEDYTMNIIDSPLSIISVNAQIASTLDVFASATNQKMIAVPVVVKGCTGTQTMTSMTFNTNGSSSASNDIANAKVYYTGNSNIFVTTTQFGSTSNGPVGSFSINGSTALVSDTNWFWLSYDIASGATTSNLVDAECNSVTISSNNYTPSTQAPSGSRMVNVPMTYTSSTTTNASTASVEQGLGFYEVVKVEVVMSSGATVDLTQLNLSTSGSNNASSNIDSARVYYTGNSSTFATTTQFGTYVSPSGSFNVAGTQALVSGTNYFWVAYKVKSAANVGDSLTAQCSQITVNAVTHTPSVTAPAGKRKIIGQYCVGSYSNDYHTQMYISRVKVGSLDNVSSYGSSYPKPYTYYSSLPACTLTIAQADVVKVLEGYSGYPIRVAAFVDLNQDGDFTDAGEKLGENTNVNSTSTFSNISFTIPSGAVVGYTRMRVRCQYYGGGAVTPCTTLSYAGETEDYNVYVAPPAAPTPSISPASSTSFCQSLGQVFTATPSNSAYTYVWKEGTTTLQSGTGTSYASFSYNPSYTGTFSITCEVTDQYSQTGISGATSVTINSNPVGGTMSASSSSLCSGQNDTLSISGNAGSVQWQQKVGAGSWTNIVGATNSTYIVQPTTTTSYRCKSTLGSCGSAFSNIVSVSIGSTSVWIGTFSSAWAFGPNWCSGTVPAGGSNVTIGSGTYQPIVASTVYCNNLTVNSGASLTINAGGTLHVNGTFTKNGTFTHNSGKLYLNTPQTLPTGPYFWLSLAGSGTYTLAGNTTINNNLIIGSGITVATAGYNLNPKRDVTCDGTINGSGTLVLDHATLDQTVFGSATISNVKVNLGTSTRAAKFYNNCTITGKLDISGGFVVINNNTTLTVGSTSTSTGDIKFNYSGAQIVTANSSTNTLLKVLGNSSAAQITGAIITTNASIHMDRPNGIKLGGNTVIGGTLTIVNGTVDQNGYDLNIGKTSTTTGNYVTSGTTSKIANTSTSAGFLRFLGSSSSSQITDVTLGSIYKLYVSRGSSLSTGISLGNSFTAKSQVGTINGSIDLNGWVLTLGATASLYEATAYPIYGSTGYIQTTRSLSTLTNSNVGTLGLILSTSGSMGSTTIVRGHTAQSSGGNPSIKRYYTITASNATTITGMMFNFYQPEYNGFSSATKLGIAKSTNGGSSWTHVGTFFRNMYAATANCGTQNLSLAATATMFTIGDTTAGYAPSVIASVAQPETSVQNVWPNPFNENLNILFTAKAEGNVTIRVTDMNGKTVRNLNAKVGQGDNNISINDMKELPAGAYMINIIGNDKVSTMRVVKANN